MSMNRSERMNEVRENRLLARWAELLRRAPSQCGGVHETDAELMPLGDGRLLALTVDSLVEELAVGLYSPREAGYVAVVSCLSDLAAVGARPIGLLLAVTLPRHRAGAVQEAVACGVRQACQPAGVSILGGDTSEGDTLQVTAVGAGIVPTGQALTRRGCRPGDHIFASGPLGLGGAHAAGTLLGAATRMPGFRPPVRSAFGTALRGLASTCIDASDGLIAAVDQLARLNGVSARIAEPLERLLHPVAREVARSAGLPWFPFLASHHGDFELVFTVPPDRMPALAHAAAEGGVDPVRVGQMESGGGVWIGDVEIDSAGLRNLATDAAAGIGTYAEALIAGGPR